MKQEQTENVGLKLVLVDKNIPNPNLGGIARYVGPASKGCSKIEVGGNIWTIRNKWILKGGGK